MSAISSVSSQALQYVQSNLQTKAVSQPKASTDPVQAVQPTVPATGNDVQGNKDNSVGGNFDTYV
ncbi:MAG: hypothetical protein LUQ11_10890 [Methylococcaceae bacterium]|nr:hypothetical protein [Methylococcaceae bacterium]